MQKAGELAKKRFEQIKIDDEILRAGFAAFPYVVMNDTNLSIGARFTYGMLLQFAWLEGSCFPGQGYLAKKMGAGRASVQRYLYELRKAKYIAIDRKDNRYNNTYTILKVRSKLKKGANLPDGTPQYDASGAPK